MKLSNSGSTVVQSSTLPVTIQGQEHLWVSAPLIPPASDLPAPRPLWGLELPCFQVARRTVRSRTKSETLAIPSPSSSSQGAFQFRSPASSSTPAWRPRLTGQVTAPSRGCLVRSWAPAPTSYVSLPGSLSSEPPSPRGEEGYQ